MQEASITHYTIIRMYTIWNNLNDFGQSNSFHLCTIWLAGFQWTKDGAAAQAFPTIRNTGVLAPLSLLWKVLKYAKLRWLLGVVMEPMRHRYLQHSSRLLLAYQVMGFTLLSRPLIWPDTADNNIFLLRQPEVLHRWFFGVASWRRRSTLICCEEICACMIVPHRFPYLFCVSTAGIGQCNARELRFVVFFKRKGVVVRTCCLNLDGRVLIQYWFFSGQTQLCTWVTGFPQLLENDIPVPFKYLHNFIK